MHRHDRNYEQLFSDVRSKLEQVGICTAGSKASMKSLLFQGFLSLALSFQRLACSFLSMQSGLVLSVRIYKEKGDSSAFQFAISGDLLSSMTEQFEQKKEWL